MERPDLSARNIARLRRVIRSKDDVRAVSAEATRYEKRRIGLGKKPWPAFDTSFEHEAEAAVERRFPGFRERYDRACADAVTEGLTPELLDLGGRTRSTREGVRSITVGLTDDLSASTEHIPLTCDLTTTECRQQIANTLDGFRDGALVLITVRPKSFITKYLDSEYARSKFITLLRMAFDRLRPGGLILIEAPLPQADREALSGTFTESNVTIQYDAASHSLLIEKQSYIAHYRS